MDQQQGLPPSRYKGCRHWLHSGSRPWQLTAVSEGSAMLNWVLVGTWPRVPELWMI